MDDFTTKVVGGLAVAAIGGSVVWVRKKFRRKKQIKFLRDALLWNFVQIGLTTPDRDINGRRDDNAIPARARRFDHLIKHMEVSLDHRVPDLAPTEVADLRSAMEQARFHSSLDLAKDDWGDLVMYACIYREFQRVRCLDLPPELPWRDDALKEWANGMMNPVTGG